jgi:hypothetical protein
MQTFIIANEHTEYCNVAGISGSKQVCFDGKTRSNTKQPLEKREIFCKGGGSKVRLPTIGLDRFYKPEEWKVVSFKKKSKIIAFQKKASVFSAATYKRREPEPNKASFAQHRFQASRQNSI